MFNYNTYHTKFKNILEIMLPILVTQVTIMGMNVSDTIMAGRAGPEDLAGVAIGSNIWMPIFTSLNGILLALMPIVAHLRGAQQEEEIPEAVLNGLYLAVFIGVCIIGLGWIFLEDVLYLMPLAPEVHSIAYRYLGAVALGIIPFFGSIVLRAFVDTMGYTQMTMKIFLLTLPLNIGFNYIFIFGKLGLPAFGGVGAGYGTAATYWLISIIYLLLIRRVSSLEHLFHFQWSLPSYAKLKEHLNIGIPLGVSIFFEASIWGVIGLFMAKFGTATIAAHQAANNFSCLLYMLPLSFSLTLTILVGVEIGARRYRSALEYAQVGIATELVVALLFVLILLGFRGEIASLYTQDEEVYRLARSFLFYSAFFQFLDGITCPLQGILRGYKDVKFAFVASSVAYWGIALPLGYFLDIYCQHGPYSYWQSIITGIFFNGLLLFWRLGYIQKRYKSLT